MGIQLTELNVTKTWLERQTTIMRKRFPNVEPSVLQEKIIDIATKRMVDKDVIIHNSYLNQQQPMKMTELINFIEKRKPILAGYGLMYQNQNDAQNPAGVMLGDFQDSRDALKKKLEVIPQGTFEYRDADLRQGNQKVRSNSYYGTCGAPSSRFFNLYTAASTTITGQIIISTASQAFEGFLGDNIKFHTLEDCMEFIMNIVEDRRPVNVTLPIKTAEETYQRLVKNFTSYKESYSKTLKSFLLTLDDYELSRIFYKNNFFTFTRECVQVQELLNKMMSTQEAYILPQDIPENMNGPLREIWKLYEYFVFYKYPPIGRIQRLRTQQREVVIVVDTDSNIAHLQNAVDVYIEEIINPEHIKDRENKEVEMTLANILCFYLSEMIDIVMRDLAKRMNILPSYGELLIMKNEFLATTLMTTKNKKWYALISNLREGVLLDPPKVTFKGLSFIKSTANSITKERFSKLVKERILEAGKNIDIPTIIKEIREFEEYIGATIDEGRTDFTTPSKTKAPEAYAEPDRIQSVRGVIAWNAVYPDNPIAAPDAVNLIKVNLDTMEDMASLERDYPEIYHNIVRKVFNHPNKKIAEKGVNVIALPAKVKSIPEWLRPYVDKEKIINDNMKLISGTINSLGLDTAELRRDYITNIMRVGSEGIKF